MQQRARYQLIRLIIVFMDQGGTKVSLQLSIVPKDFPAFNAIGMLLPTMVVKTMGRSQVFLTLGAYVMRQRVCDVLGQSTFTPEGAVTAMTIVHQDRRYDCAPR